ncbi:hypothetical protein F2P81_021103 [Scophthalmus maximus]|uniref:PDZ domain-containing protein n=1 Tax=Scophthalmus maximus TaxID=52904 RepID=A0A6A4RUJ1_SCOMX|nr:hypothetical protein F2P81_021103 [Scophthalmus maximus]
MPCALLLSLRRDSAFAPGFTLWPPPQCVSAAGVPSALAVRQSCTSDGPGAGDVRRSRKASLQSRGNTNGVGCQPIDTHSVTEMLGSLDVLYSVLIHKLMAVYEEQEAQQRGGASTSLAPSPDLYQPELSVFQPIAGGEIEVNSSVLKSSVTCGLVHKRVNARTNVKQETGSVWLGFDEEVDGQAKVPDDCCAVNLLNVGGSVTFRRLTYREEDGCDPFFLQSNTEQRPAPKLIPYTFKCFIKSDMLPQLLDWTKKTKRSQPIYYKRSCSSLTRTVEILGEDSPLGIHVVPYCSSLSGRSLGLFIRGVEEESRSRKEGLFHEDECIVRINNTDLMDKTFTQAQEVFRQAMRSPVVRLEVVPSSSRERYEKSLIGQLFGNSAGPDSSPRVAKTKEPPPPVKAKPVFKPAENSAVRLAEEAAALAAAVSTPKGRSESPLLKKSPALSSLVANKRGGRRLRIDLKKGVGQEELVCMLRSTRPGESVCLMVLRQEEMFLPREMLRSDSVANLFPQSVCSPRNPQNNRVGHQNKEEAPRVPGFVLENGKEQLMFEVPLNDSGSAGLGVSLKGNKSRETGEDLGIFIKSIIHGGAAYKDQHGVSPSRSFDGSSGLSGAMSPINGQTGPVGQHNGPVHPLTVNNALYASNVTNGSYSHMDEDEEGELYGHEEFSGSIQHSYLQERENSHVSNPAQPQCPGQNQIQNQSQRQFQHVKASKSMDLVADESNVGSLVGNATDEKKRSKERHKETSEKWLQRPGKRYNT